MPWRVCGATILFMLYSAVYIHSFRFRGPGVIICKPHHLINMAYYQVWYHVLSSIDLKASVALAIFYIRCDKCDCFFLVVVNLSLQYIFVLLIDKPMLYNKKVIIFSPYSSNMGHIGTVRNQMKCPYKRKGQVFFCCCRFFLCLLGYLIMIVKIHDMIFVNYTTEQYYQILSI